MSTVSWVKPVQTTEDLDYWDWAVLACEISWRDLILSKTQTLHSILVPAYASSNYFAAENYRIRSFSLLRQCRYCSKC